MTPSSQNEPTPTPSGLQQLVARFADCPDFRTDYGGNKVHALVDILVIAICAVVGGADSWTAVARFGKAHHSWFGSFLSLPNGIPSHDTFRRVFMLLDPDQLNCRFASWVRDITPLLPTNHIAVDGKTMRGSDNPQTGLKALHMVHAFAVEQGVCLAQQATHEKSNEITAIPQLLRLLDIRGATVTIDAIGCQKAIAQQIVTSGGEYVLGLKANQPNLRTDVVAVLAEVAQQQPVELGENYSHTEQINRAREERRTCYTTQDLSGVQDRAAWSGLKTIGVIVSERKTGEKVETEKRYFISSRKLSAKEMLKVVRDHWQVENSLHWVLDVVFGEDEHQLGAGHGPDNFTTLRKLAHALIKNSKPKEGIKATRQMAGWNVKVLEDVLSAAAKHLENNNT